MTPAAIKQAVADKSYAALKKDLARATSEQLRAAWPGLTFWEKAVAFKLLDIPKALELFGALEKPDQIFILSIRHRGALGPAVDNLSDQEAAALFHSLSNADEQKMIDFFAIQ
jgi:Mg/Co/Ni transporter MgtE